LRLDPFLYPTQRQTAENKEAEESPHSINPRTKHAYVWLHFRPYSEVIWVIFSLAAQVSTVVSYSGELLHAVT